MGEQRIILEEDVDYDERDTGNIHPDVSIRISNFKELLGSSAENCLRLVNKPITPLPL